MRRDRLRQRLERELERLRVLEGRRSRFSEAWSYHLDAREILHFHSDRAIDLRLTRRVIKDERQRLESDPRVRMGGRQRDWVELRMETAADVPFVMSLIDLAIRANRRSSG